MSEQEELGCLHLLPSLMHMAGHNLAVILPKYKGRLNLQLKFLVRILLRDILTIFKKLMTLKVLQVLQKLD